MKLPVVPSASPWGMKFNYSSLKITWLMWLLQRSLGQQTEARTHQRRLANSVGEIRVDAAFLPRSAPRSQHFPLRDSYIHGLPLSDLSLPYNRTENTRQRSIEEHSTGHQIRILSNSQDDQNHGKFESSEWSGAEGEQTRTKGSVIDLWQGREEMWERNGLWLIVINQYLFINCKKMQCVRDRGKVCGALHNANANLH